MAASMTYWKPCENCGNSDQGKFSQDNNFGDWDDDVTRCDVCMSAAVLTDEARAAGVTN